jgi:hypothetical protein
MKTPVAMSRRGPGNGREEASVDDEAEEAGTFGDVTVMERGTADSGW